MTFVFGAKEAGLLSTVCHSVDSEDPTLLNIGDICWALEHSLDGITLASQTRNMGH